jgi:hypothetical protein
LVGVFGELESGVLGELLPGAGALSGAPGAGGVTLPGAGALSELPGAGGVTLPGAGVKLLGAPGAGGVTLPGAGALSELPGAGGVTLPGAGVKLLGAPGAGGVTLPGAGVLSGVVVLPGVVSAGTVVLLGALGVAAVPPGQRELSGKFSHRIFIPCDDILISVGALVDSLLDCAMGDLLDSATAILVVRARDRAVPIRVRDFPIILKLTSTEHSHY